MSQNLQQSSANTPTNAVIVEGARLRGLFKPTARRVKTARALELESKGRHVWFKTLFPHLFKATPSFFHEEYLEWLWDAICAKRDNLPFPDGDSFISVWFRGGAKSSWARVAPITEAALCGDGFCLYTSGVQKQANKHLSSIETLLRSAQIKLFYPDLSEPMKGYAERSRGWSQEYIYTAAGYIFQAVGLEVGVRGANVDNKRVSMIVPDDIDDSGDSIDLSISKMDTLLSSVLPTREDKTITITAQNLVIEHGCVNQIVTGRVPALINARISGPHKMVDGLETEKVPQPDGRIRDVIIGGEPTWPYYDLRKAQADIDNYTLPVFMRECQHDFSGARTELVFQNWRDEVHVITESEFEAIYGTRKVPDRWYKYGFNDFSKTKNAYHANVAGFVTVSSQNEPLPGMFFVFNPMSFEAGTLADNVAERLIKAVSPDVLVGGRRKDWDDVLRDAYQRANLEQYFSNATRLIDERRKSLSRAIPDLVRPLLQKFNYKQFVGSHEQANDALRVYREVYGLPFSPVNPGKSGGLELLNSLMYVDEKTDHPFRSGVKGYTRFFLVVPDEKAEKPSALKPDELQDHDLFRYQVSHWRNVPLKIGELGIIEHGAQKMNDDYGQGLQFIFVGGLPEAAPLSQGETLTAATPPKSRYENLLKESPHEKGLLPHQELEFIVARDEAREALRINVSKRDMWGNILEVED